MLCIKVPGFRQRRMVRQPLLRGPKEVKSLEIALRILSTIYLHGMLDNLLVLAHVELLSKALNLSSIHVTLSITFINFYLQKSSI